MSIIFYDLLSVLPQKAFSPNTWKTRFCLNYKGVSYKTEWVGFTGIPAVYEKYGLEAPGKNPDGSPAYTLPLIYDSSTGTALADSFAIAEYLEKTYPSPSLFPNNTIALQSTFNDNLVSTAFNPLFMLVIFDVYKVVAPEDKDYFRTAREGAIGRPLEELAPTGDAAVAQWEKVKAGFAVVDGWLKKTEGPFILGDTPSWADFVLGAWFTWLKSIKQDKWEEIGQWHNGSLNQMLANLDKYAAVV